MQYQINSDAEGNWTTGTKVSGLSLENIVYARLWDGINGGSSASITITDTTVPNAATITLSSTSTNTTTAITATVTQSDSQSGVNVGASKWVYNTTSTAIGTNASSYTGGAFSGTTQSLSLKATTPGTYYLHVLTVDNAGKARETISKAVAVITPGNPDENGIFTENSTINGAEGSAFNPEIPKGFKPVDEDTAIWGDGSSAPTEEAVKAGLIIEDGEGNQFVWIAVDGTTVALGRYEFAEDGTASAYSGSYVEEDATDIENLLNKGNTIAKDIEAFKTSVANYGGYYIARYEASYGTDGKANSKVSTGTPSNTSGEEYAPTTEGQLWNNITQPNAAIACRNMYDSSYGITSDLMNSYAWDTAIVFIQAYSGNKDYSRQISINTTLANTGVNRDEVCHIQDMSSNCLEWTTETSSYASSPCVGRGGCYYSGYYTSIRGIGSTVYANNYIAFRPTLYL